MPCHAMPCGTHHLLFLLHLRFQQNHDITSFPRIASMLSGGAILAYHNMSPSGLLLLFAILPFLPHIALAAFDPSQGYFVECGGTSEITVDNVTYVPDGSYIKVGNAAIINQTGLLPTLNTVRYFPDAHSSKFCYTFPVPQSAKYLVKTIYYYGNFDGKNQPPIFDQIVDGTRWSVVNTTSDYAKGLSSYYEVIVAAMGRTLSVCLARNAQTGRSSPFISALEVTRLDDSMYNPVDFENYALVSVARNSFGDASIISYPDDKFNRVWQPFKDQNPVVISENNITSSDFWNLPPVEALKSGITTSRGKTVEIQWPPVPLPGTYYYISLYFQDNRTPSPYSWRTFDVAINGHTFFSNLNATTKGVTVYAAQWPLSGQTKVTLTPGADSPVGPVINAGEVYQLLPLGGRTVTGDVIAMEDLARSILESPADWKGDPCRPRGNSWTGVTCSNDFNARVMTVNLTNAGLSGSLPASIGNLDALVHLWLGGNKLSGIIPDMSGLKMLETLHLENNTFVGSLPPSLKDLPKLSEVKSDLPATGDSAPSVPKP